MTPQANRIIIDANNSGRADRSVQQLTGLTRSKVTALFEHGCVCVNGRPCPEAFHRVGPGDIVEVTRDGQKSYQAKSRQWTDKSFRVVFEDEHVIVVDKAAGVMTVPSPSHKGVSLVEAVARYLNRGDFGPKPIVVQRLDRGVSGLLVMARTRPAGDLLRSQFAGHKPLREYAAIVAGVPPDESGTFRSRLVTSGNLNQRSTQDSEEGELAVTHYEVEKSVADMTLVRCRLETGKRHQIRVQFAEARNPVLGDDRYQPKGAAKHPRWPHKRLALHACVLEFTHPETGRLLHFESPLPREFASAMRPGNRNSTSTIRS